MIDFPANPVDGQEYTASNGAVYKWQADPGVWFSYAGPPDSTGSGAIVLQFSPTLTGNPQTPTGAPGDSGGTIANTQFVAQAVALRQPNYVPDLAERILNASGSVSIFMATATWVRARAQAGAGPYTYDFLVSAVGAVSGNNIMFTVACESINGTVRIISDDAVLLQTINLAAGTVSVELIFIDHWRKAISSVS